MSMMTQPAVCRLKTSVLVVTANARIAPAQTNIRPIPVLMDLTVLSWRSRAAVMADYGRWADASRRQGWVEQPAPQVAERPGEQPGHVHLRDTEAGADLGLGEVSIEAHDEDALLAFGEFLPVRGDGLHVNSVLDLGVLAAEHVAQLGGVFPVRQRRVERVGAEHHVRLPGLEQVLAADAEPLRELIVPRRSAQLMGELFGRLAQLEQ